MIINGKKLSEEILENIKNQYENAGKPGCKLVVISVGNDDASAVYVRNKQKAAESVGIQFIHKLFDMNTSCNIIETYISECNNDPTIYGIIVQLPIISNILTDEEKLNLPQCISSFKDVDGFLNDSEFIPCTPKGIIRLLETIPEYELEGKTALVIGRSEIVGKPVARLLLDKNCTVIQAHSRTPEYNLFKFFEQADIIISAVGKPNIINSQHLGSYYPNKVIIDVGMNRDENNRLCGDLLESFKSEFTYYTPVPGGVGPMTVAMLIENTWESYKKYNS